MKKKYLWFIPPVIILLLFVFYAFFFKRVDISKIDSDLEKLSTVFSDSAVDIAQSIDEGLDLDSLIAEIKTEYSKSVKHNKIPMSINENGIAENRLAICISNVLSKNLTHPNGHLYFTSPYETFFPFLSYILFDSGILFEKSGSEYRVYSSNDDRIKQGMLYTGSTENLFKTIADGKELYRFGVFSNVFLKNTKISVEENDYEIKLTYNPGTIETVENLSYTNDGGTLFVNFNSCDWHTEAEQNRIFDVIEELAGIIKEGNTDLIVFDLRNNPGGYSTVPYSLFGALICGTTDDMSDDFVEYIKYYNYLHSDRICINTKASRSRLSLQGYGDDNLTRFLLTKTDEKYPVLSDPEEEYKTEITPVYNGKIILITDIYTGSAAENFVLLVKTAFPDNTIIVGQNTRGALDYATVFQFKLPDSKLSFLISMVDNTKTPLLKNSTTWHGDTKGCYPDYWFMFNGDFDVEDIFVIARDH
jgi:hypothetical protein